MTDTVVLVGNVGVEPKLKGKGKNASTFFSLALQNPSYTNAKGEEVEPEPHWVNVNAFGRLAENIVETVTKGQNVFVLARVNTYPDKNIVDDDDRPIIRTSFRAIDAGPSLKWQVADVEKDANSPKGVAKKSSAKRADDYADDDVDDVADDTTDDADDDDEEAAAPPRRRRTASKSGATARKRSTSKSREPVF